MEHTKTPYDETTTNPFGDMKFHTTFIDKEPNTLNVFLLLDTATTNIIFRDKKYFFISRSCHDKTYYHYHW